ncbi:MAG TPA: hypothetical protein VN495_00340 [Candidatus Paceibacterota bacterium]|nr:hypothetical protein [Candidatus Paceibacterota bacterium]
MKSKLRIAGITVATSVLPLVTYAQTVQSILNTFGSILNILVALAIGVAIIAFFWGLIKYIAKAGDEKAKGLQLMLYGILGIFVMVSVWGLVRLLGQTFLPNANTLPIPAPYQYQPQ